MRKTVIFISVAAIALTGVFLFFGRDNSTEPKGKVVIFGDSLAQGVGAEEDESVAAVMTRRLSLPVINRGRSGETTASAKSRLDEIVSEHADVIIIIIGGNDALTGIPKEISVSNLSDIVAYLTEGGAHIILVGPPGENFTSQYNKAFSELAREKEIGYSGDAFDGLFGNRQYMSDSLHLNAAGYAILAERLEEDVRDALSISN